jgi:predicted RNA-binding Zn ribbon-like protein
MGMAVSRSTRPARGDATASKPVPLRRMGKVAEGADGDASRGQLSAGALCLDFVSTFDSSDDDEVELLPSPERLGDWLDSFGLPVPAGGVTVDDLDAARGLRGAVDRLARALISAQEVRPSDVRSINVVAQRHTPVFLLRPTGRQRTVVEEIDVAGSLSVIARDAIHLFADSDLDRLRECARPSCATLFYDRSPSGKRRWCAMKGCGEIVASASYRQRRAAKATS